MAFAASGLALVGQQIGGKHRVFEYRTTDTVTTVTGNDYVPLASNYGLVEGDNVRHIKTDDNPPTVTNLFVSEIDASDNATFSQAVGSSLGAVNQPATGSIYLREVRGPGGYFELHFTLTAVEMAVTDAGVSGSSASHKLYDFVQGSITGLGCRQDYTAFAEGAALTGGAGDAAFVMGVGSAAANAGDGALTGTEVDFGAVTGTITLSGGAGTGTKHSGAGLNSSGAVDGTTTAADLYLNWSGTAATIDANSTITVTGTVSVIGLFMGDD